MSLYSYLCFFVPVIHRVLIAWPETYQLQIRPGRSEGGRQETYFTMRLAPDTIEICLAWRLMNVFKTLSLEALSQSVSTSYRLAHECEDRILWALQVQQASTGKFLCVRITSCTVCVAISKVEQQPCEWRSEV